MFQEKYQYHKFFKTTIISAIYFFVMYLYMPFLSPYLSTLGWSESLKGVFFALFSFAGIFFSIIAGNIADKIGRYKLIMFGIFIEILILIGYIFFQQIVMLFILRIFACLAYSAIILGGQARVNDDVENHRRGRINGLFHTVISITAIVAPLLGGFIADHYNFIRLFEISAIIMIITLIGLYIYDFFFYDDNHPHREKTKITMADFNILSNIKSVFIYKELRLAIFLGVVVNVAVPLITLVFPYVIIQQWGLSNAHLSIVIFLNAFAHIFQVFFGYLSEKIGNAKAIFLGVSFEAICLLAMFFTNRFDILLIFVFLRSIGTSLWNVSVMNYMSDVGEAHNIEGRVLGNYNSVIRMFMVISFILTGLLLVSLGKWIFLIYGAIALGGILFVRKSLLSTQEKIEEIIEKSPQEE